VCQKKERTKTKDAKSKCMKDVIDQDNEESQKRLDVDRQY
jgi:hypothetical protein